MFSPISLRWSTDEHLVDKYRSTKKSPPSLRDVQQMILLLISISNISLVSLFQASLSETIKWGPLPWQDLYHQWDDSTGLLVQAYWSSRDKSKDEPLVDENLNHLAEMTQQISLFLISISPISQKMTQQNLIPSPWGASENRWASCRWTAPLSQRDFINRWAFSWWGPEPSLWDGLTDKPLIDEDLSHFSEMTDSLLETRQVAVCSLWPKLAIQVSKKIKTLLDMIMGCLNLKKEVLRYSSLIDLYYMSSTKVVFTVRYCKPYDR